MDIKETALPGVLEITPKRFGDHRGFFSETWNKVSWAAAGIDLNFVQDNHSLSAAQGTLRGLHYQTPPYQEVKILRCTRGAVFDVVLDLRKDSPTYKQWHGVELTQDNATMLYVPEGCATGFYTLTDDAEINYHATEFYQPAAATGVRWNDSAFNIQWPGEPTIMSDNDMNWPDYTD